MGTAEIIFSHAVQNRTVAHRWVERHFMLVPGKEKYNFRVHPDVDRHRPSLYAGRCFDVLGALRFLVQVHGGIEAFLTEEMRQEAAACGRAKSSVTEAARFVLDRYHLTEPFLNELRFSRGGQAVGQANCLHLDLTSLPDVKILALLHGPRLGQSLLDRVRRGRTSVVWESQPLGGPWRKKTAAW